MRLQTRTWDQNGPKFIFDATYITEGTYTCELNFSADSNCPIFIPAILNEENYKKGKYFIKDELGQYILAEDEYQEEINYYEKTEIEWEINILEKDGAKILFPDGKKFAGSFTMENYSQSALQSFEIQFDSNARQEDFLGFELRVNWNGYTYANITRYEETQRGVVNARLNSSDSLFWAPELYYNNDYVRMTDELTIYWDYFYGEEKSQEIVLTLSEQPRKDSVKENEKTLDEWLNELDQEIEEEEILTTFSVPVNTRSTNIQLGGLSKQPTPGLDLYVTMYARGATSISNKVKGIVAQINQPPNQAELSLTSLNTSISEENEITFKISANNTFQQVIGEEERVIIENSQMIDEELQESIVYRFDEGWETTIPSFVSADFSAEKYPVIKVIVLAKPIQNIENFSNLEIISCGIPKGVAPWTQTYSVGIVGIPEGTSLGYDIINNPNFKKNSFTMSSSTWNSSNIDISNLDTDLNWHLCLTIDYYGHGYNLQSVKLTGGIESRTFNFLTNDQDNTQEDYKDLSQNLWYSINNGSKIKVKERVDSNLAAFLTLSKEELLKMNIQEPGTYSLEAYVYDDLEYSQPVSQIFSYYPELSFKKVEIRKEQLSTGKEGEELVKNVTFNFTLKNNVTKLYEQVIIKGYDANGQFKTSYLPKDFYTYDFSNQQKNIKINVALIDLEALGFNFFREISFDYRLSYQLNFEQYIEYQDINWYYCPTARKEEEVFPEDSILVFSPEATECSQENYFSNILTITTFYPEPGIPYPAHDSMSARFYKIGAASYFKEEKLEIVDNKWTKAIELKDWVDPGEQITIELIYKDILGNTISHPAGAEKYIRASSPSFANSQIAQNPSPVKPFSTKEWKIIHSLAQAQGTTDYLDENSQIVIKGIKYTYEISFLNTSKVLESYNLYINELYFQRELAFDQDDINEIFLENRNLNEEITANFTITAEDSFGQTTSISQKILIDYRESPVWPEKAVLSILHDYTVAQTERANVDISSLPLASTDINTQMFNAGEGIVFKFPKPVDANGENDIVEFVFFLSRQDLLENSVPPFQEEYAKQWLIVPISDLIVGEDGFYYYKYNASTYQKNECFYFTLMARDSTGLTSSFLTTNGNPIFGCRTVPPVFNQDTINIKTKEITNGWNIDLTWKNFVIEDLGGSATSEGWNEDYYEIYPNLEREITNYNKDIYLLVEISSTSDFSNPNEIVSRQLRQESVENYIDFKPYSTNESKQIALGISEEELTSAKLTNSEKIYLRFTLMAAYGINAYIKSIPQIVSYFGDIPTVSHRAHHVGINNNIFESEDVLVISNYQNHHYIRFIGVDEEGNKSEIKIDLRTGTIEGGTFANIIIDGGTW